MANEITILGANGTKGQEGGTSAFYINNKNVIDAGNLLVPLKEAVAEIETVWLTHSHLDHIIDIAYILDSYFRERQKPLVIRGLPETLEAVKIHFMNDIIWPDFSKIMLNDSKGPALIYKPITLSTPYILDERTKIEAFATDHTVPSCGYIVTQENSAVLITADTYSLENVVKNIVSNEMIKALVVECSFPDEMEYLAKVSKHLTAALLFDGLKSVEDRGLALYINHIKPLHHQKIAAEISRKKGPWTVKILKDGEKIHF